MNRGGSISQENQGAWLAEKELLTIVMSTGLQKLTVTDNEKAQQMKMACKMSVLTTALSPPITVYITKINHTPT